MENIVAHIQEVLRRVTVSVDAISYSATRKDASLRQYKTEQLDAADIIGGLCMLAQQEPEVTEQWYRSSLSQLAIRAIEGDSAAGLALRLLCDQ